MSHMKVVKFFSIQFQLGATVYNTTTQPLLVHNQNHLIRIYVLELNHNYKKVICNGLKKSVCKCHLSLNNVNVTDMYMFCSTSGHGHLLILVL